MTGRKSVESAYREDPLSLARAHDAHKSRSKSSGAAPANEHFSGLYRCGRIMTSIFDRGRHMKYDYHVASRTSKSEERNTTLAAAYAEVTGSTKTSRSSSIAESSLLTVPISTSSTRTSSESSDCRRKRRDGMSVA